MDKEIKEHLDEEDCGNEQELMDRRGFLRGLGKWSKIVIGGALLGSALLNPGTEKEAEAAAWANRAGGGGAVVRPGGGAAWANRGVAWANRGAAWANRGGAVVVVPGGSAWANRVGGGGAWANRGAAWANRGGTWVNRF